MNIKKINTSEALEYIFDIYDFIFLQDIIVSNKEAKRKKNGEFKILLVNERDFTDNIYTNSYDESIFQWIGGFDEDENCVMLQLISLENKDRVELIVCQKLTNEKNVFNQIVKFVEDTYKKDIYTFALNDYLKNYYIKQGFVEIEPLDDYIYKKYNNIK